MPRGENNRKLSDADLAEVERMYTTQNLDGTWNGSTVIAHRFSVHRNAIMHHLKRMGIERRDGATAHSGGKRCKPITRLPVGEPPLCRCGCEERTPWNRAKNCWYAKVPGHRMPPKEPRNRSRPGALNPAWKGGVTPLRQRLYKTPEWKALVSAVFKRDSYRCRRCDAPKTRGRKLHAHHIATFADAPEQRFVMTNLVTLCGDCHRWVHSKANTDRLYLAT